MDILDPSRINCGQRITLGSPGNVASHKGVDMNEAVYCEWCGSDVKEGDHGYCALALEDQDAGDIGFLSSVGQTFH